MVMTAVMVFVVIALSAIAAAHVPAITVPAAAMKAEVFASSAAITMVLEEVKVALLTFRKDADQEVAFLTFQQTLDQIQSRWREAHKAGGAGEARGRAQSR